MRTDDLNQAFTVQIFDKHQHVEETLAIASNLSVAIAAYEAAVSVRPGANVVLRKGAHVVKETKAG